jgi:UDP-GlcNAc:undecaprenyl-phosphate GlcNAc-1-phosphate transferase
MMSGWILFFAGITSFLFSLALMPLVIRIAHRYKWYDLPDKRKIHKGLIPRLGGEVLFLSTISTALIFSVIHPHGILVIRYLPIFTGLAMLHYIGLFDDFRNLKAPLKLAIQIIAAVCITLSGLLIKSISLPYIGTIHLGWAAYPVTVIWIIGLANAINLVDGMDGLAGGIAAFASLAMGIIAILEGQYLTAMLAFILFGSVTGFLIFNFPPARIFMGDSGSLFLGAALAVLPLMGISKAASIGTLIIPLTLLIVPVLDTFSAIIRRIVKGRSPFFPDKEHIHHKLLDMGLSERKILALIYGFSIYLGAVAVTSVILPRETNVYVILVVWAGSLLAFYLLNLLRGKRAVSDKQAKEKNSAS